MSILKKKKELEERNKNVIYDAAKVKCKKRRHKNARKYFIWGAWHTVAEVAERLNLSRQYCHLKLAGGYIRYLEEYKRDTWQVEWRDNKKKEKYSPNNETSIESTSKDNKVEEFSFLEAMDKMD